MATTIDEWKVYAYAQNVHHLAQGMSNKLRGTTMEHSEPAKAIAFDRLGAMTGRTPTRLETIVHATPSHTRRWAIPGPWTFDAIVDSFDKAQQIHTPESEYAKAGAAAYNHAVDQKVIDAAVGNAMEGEGTMVAVPLPAGQIIAVDTTGFSFKKIVTARGILGTNTNNELSVYGPYYMVYHPMDILWLLNDPKMTSADYVAVRSLMAGEPVPGYMGFNWIASNQLKTGLDAQPATVRSAIAYAKAGMGFSTNMGERKERMVERPDIVGHPQQVSIFDQFGAVRIDDLLVVRIDVDTAASPAA